MSCRLVDLITTLEFISMYVISTGKEQIAVHMYYLCYLLDIAAIELSYFRFFKM